MASVLLIAGFWWLLSSVSDSLYGHWELVDAEIISNADLPPMAGRDLTKLEFQEDGTGRAYSKRGESWQPFSFTLDNPGRPTTITLIHPESGDSTNQSIALLSDRHLVLSKSDATTSTAPDDSATIEELTELRLTFHRHHEDAVPKAKRELAALRERGAIVLLNARGEAV